MKGDRPLVYISLGTILKGGTAFFQACIEAFRGENVDVIISVGESFKIKKLKRVPSNVHIYNRVPQLTVLQMADVFVTHGGMNSVSEALVYGVPMVVIPFVSDQFVNARSVEQLGAGRVLAYEAAKGSALRDAVYSVLKDEKNRANLQEIQTLIQAAPGNEGAAEYIIRYAKK